jgi:hypothetical protein
VFIKYSVDKELTTRSAKSHDFALFFKFLKDLNAIKVS